jgi:hypothetical protein
MLNRIGNAKTDNYVTGVRGVLHGAMALDLARYLNVPPARIPGEGGERLDDLPVGATDRRHRSALDAGRRTVSRRHSVVTISPRHPYTWLFCAGWSRIRRIQCLKVLQCERLEVGHAPSSNFLRRAQLFETRYNVGELGVGDWRVQQIQIEVVSAETAEASLASTRHAVFRHFVGLHFGNQEYAVTLTGDHVAY